MGGRREHTFPQRRHTNGQRTHQKCSTSLTIREVNTNQDHHEISLHTSQNGKNEQVRKRQMLAEMQRKGNLLHCWWECKLVRPLWKTVWRFLKKLKTELSNDPAIALLGIYPKDTNVVKRRGTRTPTFTAAMSTIAQL